MQREWVWSLIENLRSHMPYGMVKKKSCCFFFNIFYLFIYLFLFVVNFVIHWNETAMGLILKKGEGKLKGMK